MVTSEPTYLMFGDGIPHVVLGAKLLHGHGDSVLGDADLKGSELVPFLLWS
jgi:hypothetical protein